jgi:hypothetical protein
MRLIYEGFIGGKSLNQGQSSAGGKAHDGWDPVCHLLFGEQMVCQVSWDLGDHLT